MSLKNINNILIDRFAVHPRPLLMRPVIGSDSTTPSRAVAPAPATQFLTPLLNLLLLLAAPLAATLAPAPALIPSTTTWITAMTGQYLNL